MNFKQERLREEIALVAAFTHQKIGQSLQVELDDGLEYVMFHNFPLPSSFGYRAIPVLIVTSNYPDLPPPGLHIPGAFPATNEISRKFGHVLTSPVYRDKVEELQNAGWHWVCWHYQDWRWQYSPRQIHDGDNLFKFLLTFYENLC